MTSIDHQPEIDRLLEQATPDLVTAPPVDDIRSVVRRRRTARAVAGAVMAVAGAIVVTMMITGRDPSRVETVGVDTFPTPTTVEQPTTTTTQAPPSTTLPASEARWFLVPPEGTEFWLSDRHLESKLLRPQTDAEYLVLASNPDDLPESDLALVYYLSEATRDRIGPPGSASRESRFVTVGDVTVRVRTAPGTDRVSAFRDSVGDEPPGAFVVLGTGITADEATRISISTRYGQTAPTVVLPEGFRLVPMPRRERSYLDHTTIIRWETELGEAGLRMDPVLLARQAALIGANQDIEWIDTPAGMAVYVPPVSNQNEAQLIWAQDNMTMALAIGEERDGVGLPELLAEASRLERISQPATTRRLLANESHPESPYLADRVGTATEWLSQIPVPPGVDTEALIQGSPSTEYELSTFLASYLACAWQVELKRAVADGDDDQAQTALDALASQLDWPILEAVRSSSAAIYPDEAWHRTAETEDRERQRSDIGSAESTEAAAALFLDGGKYTNSSCRP